VKYTLTLDPKATEGSGSRLTSDDKIIVYPVCGMPDGDWATIANTNAKVVNDWQIGRKPADDGLVDWTGHYGSADEALAVLQSEIDQTHP
jgi:hypothetical protein